MGHGKRELELGTILNTDSYLGVDFQIIKEEEINSKKIFTIQNTYSGKLQELEETELTKKYRYQYRLSFNLYQARNNHAVN